MNVDDVTVEVDKYASPMRRNYPGINGYNPEPMAVSNVILGYTRE
jgi:hypothetical protein